MSVIDEKIFLYELRNITEQLKILNELKILELYSKFPTNTSECSKVLDRIDRIKEKLKERVQNG